MSASSQGAAMMAGGITDAVERGETAIEAVVLSEVVNNKVRTPVVLLGQFAAANADASGYLEQNPDLLNDINEGNKAWAKRMSQSFGANIRYGGALARGGFDNDLPDETLNRLARDEQDTLFVITRGAESKLADETAHGQLLQRLQARGINLFEKTYPTATHPYTMTVSSIADPINQLEELRHAA